MTDVAAGDHRDGSDLDLSGAERRLAQIEAALERIEEGTYGRCASCGEEIDDALLGEDPVRVTCARCAVA